MIHEIDQMRHQNVYAIYRKCRFGILELDPLILPCRMARIVKHRCRFLTLQIRSFVSRAQRTRTVADFQLIRLCVVTNPRNQIHIGNKTPVDNKETNKRRRVVVDIAMVDIEYTKGGPGQTLLLYS
jgi:hypothetical protein